MAALVEGQQYGLSSTNTAFEHRSVVHLKLTDSALKAIEDFIKCKDVSKKPTIQFQGNQGFFKIPSRSSDAKTFQFTVASLGDSNGLDCVYQPDIKYGNHLTNAGAMVNKISVHATSDVFNKTQEKMKTAQEEWTKVRTQEIKPSGPGISRKIRKVKKESELKNPLPPSRHERDNDLKSRIQEAKRESEHRNMMHQASKANHPSPSAIKPPKTAVVSPFTSHSSNMSRNQDVHRNNTVSSSNNQVSSSSSSPHQLVSSSTSIRSPSSSSSSSSNVIKSSGNSAVMSMSLRDRIVHLLAAKSFKKPELYLRLAKDGLQEKDKSNYGAVLEEVSVFNTRDSRFSLAKHAYGDVRLGWPFYNDTDREYVKKKLQSLSPVSSPATNQSSPKGSPNNTQKRPSDNPIDTHQPAKKQRISHYEKYRKENKPAVIAMDESNDRQHKKENIDESVNVTSSTSDTPDYLNKYLTISNAGQRAKYKNDFNTEYEEYRDLHKNVEKVTKKFAELEAMMRRSQPGTEEYENLKNRIRKEYKHQKDDPKYMEQRKRFEYLHKKLGHIKQLILEYDNSQTVAS